MKSKTKPGATVFLGGAELMNYLVTTAFQVSSLHNLAQAQKKKIKGSKEHRVKRNALL
jgi:hypothetical protein